MPEKNENLILLKKGRMPVPMFDLTNKERSQKTLVGYLQDESEIRTTGVDAANDYLTWGGNGRSTSNLFIVLGIGLTVGFLIGILIDSMMVYVPEDVMGFL